MIIEKCRFPCMIIERCRFPCMIIERLQHGFGELSLGISAMIFIFLIIPNKKVCVYILYCNGYLGWIHVVHVWCTGGGLYINRVKTQQATKRSRTID